MSFPAHFLPREKCSRHSFFLKTGGGCVGPGPDPRDHFLMVGEGDQSLPRAPQSQKAPFLTSPYSQGWAGLELPALALDPLIFRALGIYLGLDCTFLGLNC